MCSNAALALAPGGVEQGSLVVTHYQLTQGRFYLRVQWPPSALWRKYWLQGPLTKYLFQTHPIIQMLQKHFTSSEDIYFEWRNISEKQYFPKYGFEYKNCSLKTVRSTHFFWYRNLSWHLEHDILILVLTDISWPLHCTVENLLMPNKINDLTQHFNFIWAIQLKTKNIHWSQIITQTFPLKL